MLAAQIDALATSVRQHVTADETSGRAGLIANLEAYMSELLNDSARATKFRDRILSELRSGEQVLFAADAQVLEPTGDSSFNLFLDCVVVTNERLIAVDGKMMGRATLHSAPWAEVEKVGRAKHGEVLIQKSYDTSSHMGPGRWPIWKVSIWEGKSHKTPLDKKRLELLLLSIQEAWQEVRKAAEASHAAEVASAYDELKRRRES